MRLQAGRQEIIENLQAMVLERLVAWVENSENQPPRPTNGTVSAKRLPTSILFYRDGLSESQFEECMQKEVLAVERAFNALTAKYNRTNVQLKLTFVVVGKRHNTRFFPKRNNETHGPPRNLNGNVRPGLFVNDIVTTPNDFNFYLQSHAAPNGTARSAHYHVLRDGMGFGGTANNRLADVTNFLCYSFPRALKGVSYVGPAYMTDSLCERGRMYLRHWIPPTSFQLPADNNGAPWTNDAIQQWKTRKALDLSNNPDMWSQHYQHSDMPGSPKRHNPWHPRLDNTMFWI